MTPNIPEPTALEALRELGERASPTPWEARGGFYVDCPDGWVLEAVHRPTSPAAVSKRGAEANAAYATVAVNSIDAAVAALEGTIDDTHMLLEGCLAGKRDDDNEDQEREQAQADILRCVMGFFREHGGPEALDAIRKAAQEAQR